MSGTETGSGDASSPVESPGGMADRPPGNTLGARADLAGINWMTQLWGEPFDCTTNLMARLAGGTFFIAQIEETCRSRFTPSGRPEYRREPIRRADLNDAQLRLIMAAEGVAKTRPGVADVAANTVLRQLVVTEEPVHGFYPRLLADGAVDDRGLRPTGPMLSVQREIPPANGLRWVWSAREVGRADFAALAADDMATHYPAGIAELFAKYMSEGSEYAYMFVGAPRPVVNGLGTGTTCGIGRENTIVPAAGPTMRPCLGRCALYEVTTTDTKPLG